MNGSIEWSKIVTNAISLLVASTFMGAAMVVWNAAVKQPDAIAKKVEEAKLELKATQDAQEGAQKALVGELASLATALDSLRLEVANLAHVSSNVAVATNVKPSPVLTNLPMPAATHERWIPEREKAVARINGEIDTYQKERFNDRTRYLPNVQMAVPKN